MENESTKIINKPSIINLKELVFTIIGGCLSLVLFFIPDLSNKSFEIKLNLLIFLIIIVVILIYYIVKSNIKLNKFYKKYEIQRQSFLDNQVSLIKDNNKYIKEYNKIKNDLNDRDLIIIDILTFLNATSLEPNEFEKNCIYNLLQNIQIKVNALKRNGE